MEEDEHLVDLLEDLMAECKDASNESDARNEKMLATKACQ